MTQDINADDQLKQLSALEGANGYVIFNESGIPLKRHEKSISHEKAVHIAALVSDLWNVSKKVIQRDLKTPETLNILIEFAKFQHIKQKNDIEVIRLRTKHSYEYIITQFNEFIKQTNVAGDFTMLAIQLCGKAIEEAKKAAAAAAAAAIVQEENKEKEKK